MEYQKRTKTQRCEVSHKPESKPQHALYEGNFVFFKDGEREGRGRWAIFLRSPVRTILTTGREKRRAYFWVSQICPIDWTNPFDFLPYDTRVWQVRIRSNEKGIIVIEISFIRWQRVWYVQALRYFCIEKRGGKGINGINKRRWWYE